MRRHNILLLLTTALLISQACKLTAGQPTLSPTQPPPPTATFTALPPIPVQPGASNPDEPVFITGDIPYTSPFFLNSTAEPFVMLEDQAGFIRRDQEFEFSRPSQVIGPVEIDAEERLTYDLSLPAVPQATQVDVDNNGKQDAGVQVFAVAYWSNTWRDPFLEKRDGTGWSTIYASTITDPERDYEISGGILIVWAPDDEQGFPSGFGPDDKLFTADDPVSPIPAGYNLVDLDQQPFRVWKEARPTLTLKEGVVAVNDYSQKDYTDAFTSLFDKASREYPFTVEKGIDWQALSEQFKPRAQRAKTLEDFYRLLHDFANSIPDGHVGVSLNPDIFYQDYGGGFGLLLAELSDGRIIVSRVLPNLPADLAGIQPGYEIVTWDGQPVQDAISQVIAPFGPYSAEHTRHLAQVTYLGRVPPSSRVEVGYRKPGSSQTQQATLQAEVEYDSIFQALPSTNEDKVSLPVEGYVLDDSGLGYIRITTFSDDYNLMARVWERYIKNMIDNKVPGLILDLRANPGGSLNLARNFAGFFFEKDFDLFQTYYFNENTGKFEPTHDRTRIEPAPQLYDGPIAVLVSPDCVSACESFAYSMHQQGRAVIVGHYATAGAFGEVGQGQYLLPDDLKVQFPTGRSDTPDGKAVIEGVGVIPDIVVPVTEDSALGKIDAVLQAAIQALLKEVK